MNDVPGYHITRVFGEVMGLTVRSRNIGSQPSPFSPPSRVTSPPAEVPKGSGAVTGPRCAGRRPAWSFGGAGAMGPDQAPTGLVVGHFTDLSNLIGLASTGGSNGAPALLAPP